LNTRLVFGVLTAALLADCGISPSPAPTTTEPTAALASDAAPTAVPSPAPSATPITAAAIQCAAGRNNPPPTLLCDEAIAAALEALPSGHGAVLNASFMYQLPCPPGARCAVAAWGDTGFVIITPESHSQSVIRVTKTPSGAITTDGPDPYSPPS
jgi:hypothetical protein